MEPIKIIIDIANKNFTMNIVRALATDPDFGVSGAAEQGPADLDDILNQLPDIVIMSIDERRRNGLISARYLRRQMPSLSVVLTSEQLDDQKLLECIKAGAAACVPGTVFVMMWQSVMGAVAEGDEPILETLYRPEIAALVLSEFEAPSKLRDLQNHVLTKLLPAETELLLGIAAGNAINHPDTTVAQIKKRLRSIVHKLVMNTDVAHILDELKNIVGR